MTPARDPAAAGLLSPEFVTSLYRAIIDEGTRLQVRRPKVAAFQGERGAWSEMACQMWDADLVAIPCWHGRRRRVRPTRDH
ncbi:MAG: hypothetical protein IMZ55_15735 [Acidobacteria bacterium]|nr:hypothetical protein [Acidobacteriota bacterium]